MAKKTIAGRPTGRPFSFGQWMLTAEPAYKTCKQCAKSKVISDFYAARRNSDGRHGVCKSCHASKYSAAAGYISPSQATAKQATADRKLHCKHCSRDVLRSEWPRQASGHLKSRCGPCMDAYRTPKPRKVWTPEQRAAYARSKLGVSCEYIPQALRNEAATQRRAEKEAAHKAHIEQRRQDRAEARAAALSSLHDAHVRLFRSSAIKWLRKYHGNNEFAVRQRLRTQLRKKARLHPRLDNLMRDAINRHGNSPTVVSVCGYRIADLVAHLERLFVDGMDWAAFRRGEIHIDHKRPQSSFDLSDLDQVRACWALSNLQPLWARDNLVKGAKWERGRLAA